MSEGVARPSGHATFEIVRTQRWVPESLDARLRAWNPRTHLGDIVQACFRYLPTGLALELLDEMRVVLIGESTLAIDVIHANGECESWGVVSRKVITDSGVVKIIDAMQGLVSIGTWNFHGLGTGAAAELASDAALGSELTTQYTTNNTRPTGVVSEPVSNQYRTQGTVGVDAGVTIQEHGVFDQAAAPGGILLDRSLTGGQNMVSGESLICTWTFQLVSGG